MPILNAVKEFYYCYFHKTLTEIENYKLTKHETANSCKQK